MSWTPYKGEFTYQHQAKTASLALSNGAVVDIVSGFIVVAAITRAPHSGVVQRTVVSTDADYAATTILPVLTPRFTNSEWKVDVLSGDTLATTDVGNFLDLAGTPVGSEVTNATSADDAALCTKFLGANLGAFILNSYKGLQNGIGTAA